MSNLIGQSLGRYHILEQLGEGGMATVYKAYDTRLEGDVAVKVIRTENLAPSVLERALKRFEREAKALARLTHPNIIKVTDFGEHDGKPFLVLEYLSGGTLKKRLGKPIEWEEAMRLLLPIAKALDYAHRQNMIHRDVKPSNILITADGEPMLTDFGIAKVLDLEETADLTGTGMGIGTPEYMAPEQWTGNTTAQSDLYSLGVVLYEMITGRKPYTAETPAAILLKQATEPLPRPSGYVSNLPDKVEKILIKALARDPKDRYKDMGEFTKAVEGSLKSTSSPVERAKPQSVSKPPEKTLDTMATVDQEWGETKTPQVVSLNKSATRTRTQRVEPPKKQTSLMPLYLFLGLVAVVIFLSIGYIASRPATPVPVMPGETTAPIQSPTVMVQSTTIPSTLVPTIVANPNNAQGSSAEVTVADCAKPEVLCVGLVTDVGRVNDKSFNQSAWEGVLKAKEDGVADLIQYIETSDWHDYDKNIAQFADAGFDVIVTVGFGFEVATQPAALKYPNIWFIGVDQFQYWEFDDDPSNDIPNVSGLVFPEDQAGFLVGALAAMMSESGVIGAVCGTDVVPPVWRFGEGYKAGAAYADAEMGTSTEVLVVYHSDVGFDKTFTDPEWGAQTAKSMMDQGADTIFGCGGVTGNSAIIAAVRSGGYAIGIDTDQYFTLPEAAPRMLSSAMKLITPGVAELIAEVKNGSAVSGNVLGTAGYAPFHDVDGEVPAEVKAKMEEINTGLLDGSILTNVSPAKP